MSLARFKNPIHDSSCFDMVTLLDAATAEGPKRLLIAEEHRKIKIFLPIQGNIGMIVLYSFGVLQQIVEDYLKSRQK